jgi:DNA-binding response OmpR family regulator
MLATHHTDLARRIPTDILLRELAAREVPSARRPDPILRLPGLEINRAWRTATWRGQTVVLTRTELRALLVLAEAHPLPVDGGDLAATLWPQTGEVAGAESARVYAVYLRRKLPGLLPHALHGCYYLALEGAS